MVTLRIKGTKNTKNTQLRRTSHRPKAKTGMISRKHRKTQNMKYSSPRVRRRTTILNTSRRSLHESIPLNSYFCIECRSPSSVYTVSEAGSAQCKHKGCARIEERKDCIYQHAKIKVCADNDVWSRFMGHWEGHTLWVRNRINTPPGSETGTAGPSGSETEAVMNPESEAGRAVPPGSERGTAS